MPVKKINIENADHALALFGHEDANLRYVERRFKVHAFVRRDRASGGISLVLRGSTKRLSEAMDYLSGHHQPQEAGSEPARENEDSRACPQAVFTTYFNRGIVPKTGNQNKYVEAMESNDIVVAIGPAGTGKTFLAVAYALKCLNDKKVSRIVLSRPVVEAGEKLGFLPGDLYEKLYPYLKPLYDAFFAMLGPEKFKSMQVTETIEIVPLAYMRGRTLEDAFIILDEAQNTTQNQMKMFLTRMGQGSRIVVTGDITQVDLENKKLSGLEISEQILAGIDNVVFIRLDETDVVRHPLVKRVIRAYDDWEKRPAPQPHSGGLGRLESQGDATSLGDGNMARGHGRPASIP